MRTDEMLKVQEMHDELMARMGELKAILLRARDYISREQVVSAERDAVLRWIDEEVGK